MRRSVTAAFLCAEGALYAAFLLLDGTGHSLAAVPVKYAGVLLCGAFSLWAWTRGGDRLVFPALALTAVADWFLLVLDRGYAIGVAVFLAVQTVYLLRLRRRGGGLGAPLRAALALLVLAGFWALGQTAPLDLLAGLYFSQLLANAALAWRAEERPPLFAVGLTLFVGCDLCVGLVNSGLAAGAYPLVSMGMWLFYLPSQVCIALSALPKEDACETEK